MQVTVARLPLYAAGLVVIVAAAVTGCAASSSSSAGAGGSFAPAPANSLDAVILAAKTTSSVNSFTGTINLQATGKPTAASSSGSAGPFSMTATFAQQLHPSILFSGDIESLSSGGMTLPGGLIEIITPNMFYMKWSYLTQTAHLTKPWLAIPLSTVSKSSGINVGQIFNQETSSGPLAQSQLLRGTTSARQVGTGSIGGVPVTEYTGTLSLDKAIPYLSSSLNTEVRQSMAANGVSKATFTVWVDGQHAVRKEVLTEAGKLVTSTMTMTITSINQPVNITLPAVGQTSQLPGGGLSGLS
jgi:hypothetical protein